KNPDRIEGFQQITIIDLETTAPGSRAPVRTVGFRPSSISFSSDGARALAVTEDGVTVVDLSTAGDPKVLRTIKLDAPIAMHDADAGGPDAPSTGDASNGGADSPPQSDAEAGAPIIPPPGKADVSITPNGEFAI